jgi:hypothetical protein
VLFARYAFAPNRLGLCGPEDWRSLLELAAAGAGESGSRGAIRLADEVDRGLRELARGFEGAFPYLALIAEAHGIADPLDARVVEAYWLGGRLSDGVDAALMARSIEERFRARLRPESWRWLADKPAYGARPTHAFHVLDVFPRLGLMRGGDVGDALAVMDACRIRWGTVLEVTSDRLEVEAVPLVLRDGRLELGPPRPESVQRWLAGSGFVADVTVGDTVSLHWDWACEVLSPARLAILRSRTLAQLHIANRTV